MFLVLNTAKITQNSEIPSITPLNLLLFESFYFLHERLAVCSTQVPVEYHVNASVVEPLEFRFVHGRKGDTAFLDYLAHPVADGGTQTEVKLQRCKHVLLAVYAEGVVKMFGKVVESEAYEGEELLQELIVTRSFYLTKDGVARFQLLLFLVVGVVQGHKTVVGYPAIYFHRLVEVKAPVLEGEFLVLLAATGVDGVPARDMLLEHEKVLLADGIDEIPVAAGDVHVPGS